MTAQWDLTWIWDSVRLYLTGLIPDIYISPWWYYWLPIGIGAIILWLILANLLPVLKPVAASFISFVIGALIWYRLGEGDRAKHDKAEIERLKAKAKAAQAPSPTRTGWF